MTEIFKATGKWVKPTAKNLRALANAEEVLECSLCASIINTAILKGVKEVEIDCKKCLWNGTVKVLYGGGTNARHNRNQ